ncbi:MAG TPA: SagB family peptide dehydrogenase [Amycolatopsis sp.]
MKAQNPDGSAETVRLWSLTEETAVETGDDDSLVVVTWWREHDLHHVPGAVRDSLHRMALGPVSMANLAAAAGSGPPGLDEVLDRLTGAVVHSLALTDGRGPIVSAVPARQAPRFRVAELGMDRPVKLSRFAAFRSADGSLVLESPLAGYRVLLTDVSSVRVATALAAATTPRGVAAATGVPPHITADVLAYLVAAGVVLVADAEAEFAEDHDPELAAWCHDDLMFHTRSRTWQRTGEPPATGRDPASGGPPIVKRGSGGPVVPLARPDVAELTAGGPALAALQEVDHHCPAFSGRTLTGEQIGEFLFRSARVRSVGPGHLPGGLSHEASQRPYFSVAGLYELEIYLTVNRCSGLVRGIHHYDPLDHALTLVNDDEEDVAQMLDMAMIAGGGRRRPSALLNVTARVARTGWVLGSAAYATTLMHVGALQQTLYLNARAMGLEAHALPVDAADRVDRALKLEWPAEVGVGECALDFPD